MKNNIWKIINDSNSIILLTHENPDGDAIGSVMAFFHFMNSINKNVDVFIEEVSEIFSYINDINNIVDKLKEEYDLGIVFDCASKQRIGQINNVVDKCKQVIVIDHHASNTNYGNINYVDSTATSCSQVIYYLFKDWNVNFNKNMYTDLVTGLLTDTDGFKNDNIDKYSFLMAADIIDNGIDISKIYNTVLCKKSISRHELMKIALSHLELLYDGKCAFTYISLNDTKSVNAKYGEHEGIVEIGRDIEGVEVSAFMREVNEGEYNISLRSTGIVDVSSIALKYNGGGHKMAAGMKIYGNFEGIKEKLLSEIIKAIDE